MSVGLLVYYLEVGIIPNIIPSEPLYKKTRITLKTLLAIILTPILHAACVAVVFRSCERRDSSHRRTQSLSYDPRFISLIPKP